jgi:hypothetical protein
MEARTLQLICARSKSGDSLSQISDLTEPTIDEVKERLGQATGLNPKETDIIVHLKQSEFCLEQIGQEFRVDFDVLKQYLPEDIEEKGRTHAMTDQGPYEISPGVSERAVLDYTLDCKTHSRFSPTMTEEAKEPHNLQPNKTLPKLQDMPTFFYCCEDDTNKLDRVNLLTGEQSCHKVPDYEFKEGCRWSELPGGSLLITGGGDHLPSNEVVRIDTLREWAVCAQPPMHTAKYFHAAVYHSLNVYILGGCSGVNVSECERYSCAESRWEVLPALPVGGRSMSAVEVENSLYALGGFATRDLDTVQKLSLDSLTWELMQLKLPQAACWFPCVKTDSQVYLLIKETLYSFTPLQVKAVKTLPESIPCYSSYYSRGTLYYEWGSGIGSLALRI